jgi:hypothetical protein
MWDILWLVAYFTDGHKAYLKIVWYNISSLFGMLCQEIFLATLYVTVTVNVFLPIKSKQNERL